MSFDNRPIGVFDSGIGGITVLRELVKKFPHENFVYLGDTARLPYGSKSPETVRKYSVQIMNYLVSRNVKALVVACNTASSQVSETVFQDRPVYNVIDPGAALAAKTTENGKIGVLATRGTIRSNAYAEKIKFYKPDAQIFNQACPLFVPLAEEAWYEEPVTNLIAFKYLQHLKAAEVDTVVLGCTHYPLLKESIRRVFGNYVHLIDSGEAVGLLIENDFNQGVLQRAESPNGTTLTVALTDASEHFENLSNELLCTVTAGFIQFETVTVV